MAHHSMVGTADPSACEEFFQSETKERKQSVLVILRRCYLTLVDNHCAAKLIEYFKHWRKWKLATHRTDWVYMPLARIYEDLMREHSLHVIRNAIFVLISKGFLKRRHNPGNGQDKTYQYQLQVEVLEEKLAESRSVKTEVPEFNSERSSITVESHTQDPPLDQFSDITSTTNDVVEEDIKNDAEQPIDNSTQKRNLLTEIRDRTGVVLNPYLQELVATASSDCIRNALEAWSEWSKGKKLSLPPAVSLAKAIKEQWKPEQSVASPPLINPPNSEQMATLEQLKQDRVIRDIWLQPFGDGKTLAVYDGKQVVLWWEYLKVQ